MQPENEPIESAPVLVVVVNHQEDLARAQEQGWYRIPVTHLPRRLAAEYVAFYQTAAFPPGERWTIRWLAPVRGYHLTTRRELIPEEPAHPRADDSYYKISLGPLRALPLPVPSRRLRRITFIPTTLDRLHAAREINDLWVKSTAQERLWNALRQAGVEAERQYPLGDEPVEGDEARPALVADFARPQAEGGVALIVIDEPRVDAGLAEPQAPRYQLALPAWHIHYATREDIAGNLTHWVEALKDA